MLTPHNVPETMAYCMDQARNLNPPDKYGSTWNNDCQAFVHVAHGVLEGGFASARAQFFGMPSEFRHRTTDLSHAPAGSSLFSQGSNPAGHTWVAANPFRSGTPGSWSTDMNPHVFGGVYKVSRNAPRDRWGHTNLGWGASINGYEIDLTGKNPPKPLQNQRYERLKLMIDRCEGMIEFARKAGDHHDVRLFRRELRHLKALYAETRHA